MGLDGLPKPKLQLIRINLMGSPRTTQHRVSRDTAHAKELSDCRQQILQLTRQVARLRKQLGKRGLPEDPEEPVSLAVQEAPKQAKPVKDICAACGCMDMSIIQTPSGKTLLVCKGCKNRKIVDGPL